MPNLPCTQDDTEDPLSNDAHRHDPEDEHVHSWPGEFVFCPMCGGGLERRDQAGTLRPTCSSCGFVHYRNPGVGAAVVVRDEAGRVLMVKRAEGASRAGLWSIPAGYVDYGEDVRAAAVRELEEETGLRVDLGDVLHVASNFHDPEKLTVGIWFEGIVVGGTLRAGDDAEEVGYFALEDLPPLAFETDVELVGILTRAEASEG